jgi:hypothetical protein
MASAPVTRNRTSGSSESSSSASSFAIDEEDGVAVRQPARTRKRASSLNAAVPLKAGSPEQLVKDLVEIYYIAEDIAAPFAIMGVTVFLRIEEGVINKIIVSNGGSYVTEISVELRTTVKDETVHRARQWLVVFRLGRKEMWDPLGRSNWDMSARYYMAEMLKGLGLEVAERLPFQQSVPLLNNIKGFGWATSRYVFMDIVAGNWSANGVHISTFESSFGASRSTSSTCDEVHRNSGLTTTLRNFMLFLGAYFHEVYLGTVEAIAKEIERSEFLYLMQGRLLTHIIDKLVGGVFKKH